MSKSFAIIPLLLIMMPSNAGCAQTPQVVSLSATGGGSQQAVSQVPKYTPVEGADLAARLASAAAKARSVSGSTPFWTAYTFDVRPGVGIDIMGGEFHGSLMSNGDTSVFIGTSNGMRVETPDLGIFLLREPGRDAITRMEVYNLRRPREYSGHQVYWAGRAGNEESLNYLRTLIEGPSGKNIQERAALALALHDDARVPELLKGLARGSKNLKVRSTAVFWLGQSGGQTEYLSTLVRDERENEDLRETAAHAIGESHDQQALATLQSLYEIVKNRDVRRAIIHATSENENRAGAYAFLLRVAQTDPDREARGQAIHSMGDDWQEAALGDLAKIYATDRDHEVRQQVIHAIGEIQGAVAQAKLVEIAKSGDHHELREQAIHQLGEKKTDSAFDELMNLFAVERNLKLKHQIVHAFSEMDIKRAEDKLMSIARDRKEDSESRQHAIQWLAERNTDGALDELFKIYDTETNTEVRQHILHALGELKSSRRAEDKLFQIARSAPEVDLRREAMQMLGEMASERSFALLTGTVGSNDEKTEVQIEAVRAISEKPVEQSVPMLIKVAKTHPSAEVRKEAIRHLGESGDPRAVDFFRELLGK